MSILSERESVTVPEGAEMMQESSEKSVASDLGVDSQIRNPPSSDIWVQRLTVGGLATTVIVAIVAVTTLQAIGKEPPSLIALLGIGALHGLSSSQSQSTARRIRDSS